MCLGNTKAFSVEKYSLGRSLGSFLFPKGQAHTCHLLKISRVRIEAIFPHWLLSLPTHPCVYFQGMGISLLAVCLPDSLQKWLS